MSKRLNKPLYGYYSCDQLFHYSSFLRRELLNHILVRISSAFLKLFEKPIEKCKELIHFSSKYFYHILEGFKTNAIEIACSISNFILIVLLQIS